MSDKIEEGIRYKNLGNEFFGKKEYQKAAENYTKAIELDDTNAIFYANRCQAQIKLELFGLAIEDATKAIELDPNFLKSYLRRAVAYGAILRYKEAVKDLKVVVNRAPNNTVAKNNLAAFTKIINEQKFEAAIRSDDDPTPISTINFDGLKDESDSMKHRLNIVVDPSVKNELNEQVIEVQDMSVSFIEEMIELFKNDKRLPKKYAYAIVVAANQLFLKDEVLTEISIPGMNKNSNSTRVLENVEKITVCGDTHGQFYDLLNIFEKYGQVNDKHAYLFNGDFVDRGSWSTEIAFLLYALKILYPNRIFINRGNHETDDMNKVYGFEGECKAKYNSFLFKIFSQSFSSLPLATLIGNDWLVMHGGLFSDEKIGLNEIRKIKRRNIQPPKEGIQMELLWTDPKETDGISPNSNRGIGIQFGPDITTRFCENNNLSGVIRSHEVRMEGYTREHNGKLITVFSAPNYCDSQGNKGACIDFTLDATKEFDLKINQFEAVPHPDIKPMAYTNNFGF